MAKDIKLSFPDMKGFYLTNIKYMVQFAKEYPDFQISQQVVGQIPWRHNIFLLQKLRSLEERIWYAEKTIENGWSRNVLLHWIDSLKAQLFAYHKLQVDNHGIFPIN